LAVDPLVGPDPGEQGVRVVFVCTLQDDGSVAPVRGEDLQHDPSMRYAASYSPSSMSIASM